MKASRENLPETVTLTYSSQHKQPIIVRITKRLFYPTSKSSRKNSKMLLKAVFVRMYIIYLILLYYKIITISQFYCNYIVVAIG